MVRVNTDEWCGYNGLPEMGRYRATVRHLAGERARDDDGNGIHEVHIDTLEGLWTGLRNLLRPFRGVNKLYLYQYVEMFEWSYNVKRVTAALLWALLYRPRMIGHLLQRKPRPILGPAPAGGEGLVRSSRLPAAGLGPEGSPAHRPGRPRVAGAGLRSAPPR
jgi:hypothetical protein